MSEKILKYKDTMKFIATAIILIWLYVRSPFNPLYSDSTPGEWAFVKLNFVYWLLVSIFLIWMIYSVNKKNFEKYSLFIFTAANFLYISFYIFYGFDVVDSGYSLSHQWAMYNGLWAENFGNISGTNLLGGFWLNIIGKPMLLWARLGFVIVQISIFVVSYKMMLLYFNPKDIFLTTLFMCIFLSTWIVYFTLNYDNLPLLFYSSSFYFLLLGLKSDTFNHRCLIISGFLFVFSAFCKITYLPSFLAMLFVVFIESDWKFNSLFRKRIIYCLTGALVGMILIVIFIIASGGDDIYTESLANTISVLKSHKELNVKNTDTHTFGNLYRIYKNEMVGLLKQVINLTILILIFGLTMFKTGSLKFVKMITAIIIFSALYCFVFDIGYRIRDSINIVLAFFVSLYIVWIIGSDNKIIKKYVVLIASSLFIFLFGYIGSDLGYRAGFHSGSALLLFSVSVILIKSCRVKFLGSVFDLKFLQYFVLFAIVLNLTIKKDILFVESDFKNLSVPFESTQLMGIKSSPERVYAVDSLISYLEGIRNLKEKRILFTHSNPMMHYLTDTNYFLKSPWDLLNNLDQLKESFIRDKPDIIVIPAVSHRLKTWPLKGAWDPVELQADKHYEFYQKFLAENDYSVLFNNSFYSVYGLRDGDSHE